MTRLYLEGDKAILTHWFTMISNNPLTFPYFCDNFWHTIAFLNKARLVFNYDENPTDWEKTYEYYISFLDSQREGYWLSENSVYIEKKDNTISIALSIVFLSHLESKLYTNIDVQTPQDRYSPDTHRDYITKYLWIQKDIIDFTIKNLVFTFEESFTFKSAKMVDVLQEICKSIDWIDATHNTLNALRYYKANPAPIDEVKQLTFWISPENVEIDSRLEANNILAYYLFNTVFLDKTYFMYRIWEVIKLWNDIFTDWVLIDRKTLDDFIQYWSSGLVVQISLPFDTLVNKIDNQDEFQKLKNDIKADYQKLYEESYNHEEVLDKVKKHMDKMLQQFSKTEFYIGTKHQKVSFIKSIVVEADKKKFYETQQKLWTEEYTQEWGRRIFKKKINIEDIEK